MTKINIISGFLGAGKTTLIKKLLSGAFENEKVVLLENEYGEVGVDSGFMRDSGIQITELNSGCICCTLVGDFSRALAELMDSYHPDRIIIEPSGVGKLSDIRRVVLEMMQTHDIALEGSATVADVGKCRMYARNFGEFFVDQIENAETIILSRTQNTTADRIEKCVELLRGYNAHARIITTPWDELTPKQMLEVIESAESLLSTDDVVLHCHDHHDHDHECGCGHDHHDHDHECGCGHDHHDHDHECGCGHDHHDHDHECGCGHDHHGHHHADEVFQNIGVETPRKFEEADIRAALDDLKDEEKYGVILRAKGILPLTDGKWLHFDYVPGESDLRYGSADYTGRLCVIGTGINEVQLKERFGL